MLPRRLDDLLANEDALLYLAVGWTLAVAAGVYFLVQPVLTMAFPAVAALLPLIFRRGLVGVVLRWVAFLLLLVFAFLGMFSVGMLFLPGAAAMAASADRAAARRAREMAP